MSRIFNCKLVSVISIFLFILPLTTAEGKSLSKEDQKVFLSMRASKNIIGTFNSFGSYLYAIHGIVIHTDDKGIGQTSLESPFPDFYRPTWAELFESIARQTKSSWNYDPNRNCWVFNKPQQPLPFKIKMATNWKMRDNGSYVSYQPTVAPVGMDICMRGTYSADNEKTQQLFFDKVKKQIALHFAQGFKRNVKVSDMKNVMVGNYNALYFEINVRQSGVVWRQWVIVDSNMAFVITSAIKPEHEKTVLPDVKMMVESFKIVKPIDQTVKKPDANDKK